MEKIEDFRANLQRVIDRHINEAARLTVWLEELDREGFDWDNVTEAQAWAVWTMSATKKVEEKRP